MLKNRIVNGQKASDATYVAHADLVRGMAVVKASAGVTAFAGEVSDKGVFLVDRENLPKGAECAYADRPDVKFDAIKADEKVILRPYVIGESFYTTEYVADAVADGTYVGAGTDGKWAKCANGTKYVSRGTESVAGATMLIVEVVA